MRIKRVRCDSFAGLVDRDIDFDDGLNLVIGKNESGKSTLVDLIYQLFFQKASMDRRNGSDKVFMQSYFPVNAAGVPGNAVDGTIKFMTKDGTYKLQKEWDLEGRCTMVLPDGSRIRDAERIEEELAKALLYGRGVYDELIFASQRRTQTVLAGILGNGSENVNELAVELTKAVMDTGIDTDAMEKDLAERVASYMGKWDFSHNMPDGGLARGIKNKWKRETGSIVEAYYAKEDIAARKTAAEYTESRIEAVNKDIADKQKEKQTLEETRASFSKVRSQILEKNANESLLTTKNKAYAKMQTAIIAWPTKEQLLKNARGLKTDLENAKLKAKYDAALVIVNERDALQTRLDGMTPVDPTDVKTAAGLEKEIAGLEGKLKGMNLTAHVKQLGAAPVEMRAAASGQDIPLGSGPVDITEAVSIKVPGVVEIDLAPKGIDVDDVTRKLADKRVELDTLLTKYNAKNADEIKELQAQYNSVSGELDLKNDKLNAALDGMLWDDLKAQATVLPAGVRDVGTVEGDIRTTCGKPIDIYIGGIESEIAAFTSEYTSLVQLNADAAAEKVAIDAIETKVNAASNIPPAFAGITDPDDYDAQLGKMIQDIDEQIDTLKFKLSDLTSELDDKSADDLAADYAAADAKFEALKAEHARWKHVYDTFLTLKNASSANPMADVEKYFKENLDVLSGGGLVLGTINDKLSSTITSGSHQLNAGILSDGTKDTISLAFRLAVLRHLYPEGGCVAVFDDPFTDMDPERTKAACGLLQQFAEDNQVIFVSCDDKYVNLMPGGNVIKIS